MVAYNTRQPNPSTSHQHPLPTVIHSPHPPHRSSHILVTTNTIVTPPIPTWFHRYHHHYHILSILIYQRFGLFISIASTLIYMLPLFTTSIVVSMTWKDTCNRSLHTYLYGVLIHTILSLLSFFLYLRTAHHTLILTKRQSYLFLFRWMVTLGSMIWNFIGSYWMFTSKTCMNASPALYYTSQILLVYFYISYLTTFILTFMTCFTFRYCMNLLSSYEHSEGLLRCVPVKVFEADQARSSTSHCHLCLDPYTASQQLREFSICHHSFHRVCAEQWLSLSITCPICHVSAFNDNIAKKPEDVPMGRFEASSQGPVSEASRGRATTQMMIPHDETTPTRTTPHPTSTSHSSVSHDEVDLFVNPVMNALQQSQEQLRTRQDSHHNKSQSQQSVAPSQQQQPTQHLRPPAPRGSQTHRPSLIRSMSNPGLASQPIIRTMSDPIDRRAEKVEDDLPPYDYDSDEESRDIVRLRRLRSFQKNRPAFIRPLPKPRSATEPNTPRNHKPFTLPSVPNDSDEEDNIEINDEIPGHAPGNMVISRQMMLNVALSPSEQRNERRIKTQPGSPRTRTLYLITQLEDDDEFIEKPDPVLNITPQNILKQQMAGYRVRRTLSIEGIAEAKASEERTQQLKQNKQRQDEMNNLKQFATTLKYMNINKMLQPKRQQPPPPVTPPLPQKHHQQPPPPPPQPPQQQQQPPFQPQHHQQPHYQPQSRVPQRPHAQTVTEAPVKIRGNIPTFDPRIPQSRPHASSAADQSRYPEVPSRPHSQSQWTPTSSIQQPPRPHSQSQWTPTASFQPPPPPLPPQSQWTPTASFQPPPPPLPPQQSSYQEKKS